MARIKYIRAMRALIRKAVRDLHIAKETGNRERIAILRRYIRENWRDRHNHRSHTRMALQPA